MENNIKKELKNFLKTRDSKLRNIIGDSQINVYVQNKFLFPYNHLDYVRDVLEESIKKYTTYFIMSCNRKEIKSFLVNDNCINIIYADIETGKEEELDFNLYELISEDYFMLEILKPFFEYKICRSGSSFMVYISSENMKVLKKNYPDIFCCLPLKCQESNKFYIEFDIYYLINKNDRNCNIVNSYDLLYIFGWL